MSDSLMADSVKKVAYDVASSTIALQHQALTNLRARAATIVAGSAVVASFVGAPALSSGAHTFWLAAGLVAFVAALLAAGCVLWPYPFEFRINARQLLDVYASATSDGDVDRVYAHVAARLADAHAANEQVIHRLHGVFQIGLLALGVEPSRCSWRSGSSGWRCRLPFMAPDESQDPPEEDLPSRDPWIDPSYPDIISPGNGTKEPIKFPDWWPFPTKPPTKRPPKETVD